MSPKHEWSLWFKPHPAEESLTYNTQSPSDEFPADFLDSGEESGNADRCIYGNISTKNFQDQHFRCVPVGLEKLGSEFHRRGCAIVRAVLQ